jgi:RNA polymerase sigma-70 factor (ECF subfamily)
VNAAQLHALQGTLDRLRAGDASAADELFRIAYNQLQAIAKRKKLDFPGLDRWERTGDIVQETALRLHQAIRRHPPATPVEFFSMAARITRCVLIDFLRHYYGPEGTGANYASKPPNPDSDGAGIGADRADQTYDPAPLAEMTELHRQIDSLPEDQRQVVDLIVYQDMTLIQAAQLLNCSVSTVKRRWLEARLQLADRLKGEWSASLP